VPDTQPVAPAHAHDPADPAADHDHTTADGAAALPGNPDLRQLRTRAYFRKFGSKVVLVGRFTPGLRFTIFFTAGTLHVRPSVFFIYDFAAAAFSVPVLVYVAWFFGGQIDKVITYARHTEHGILVAIVILATVVGIKLWRRRKRIARMAAAAE